MKKPSRSGLGWILGCVALFVLFGYFHVGDLVFGKERDLAGLLKAGSSEATTRQEIGEGYKIVEANRTPATAASKGTVTLRVIKAGITGCQGDLVLDFYGDRLYATRFYPENMDLYLTHLQDPNFAFSGIYNLRATPDIYRNGIHVWLCKDDQGRSYVGWEDMLIDRELPQSIAGSQPH